MVGSRKPKGTGVRSVLRAIAVLRAFRVSQPEMSLSQIAAAAEIDKGTARRLLLTLREAGLVTQNPQTQLYALGLAMIDLGAAVPEASDLRTTVRPVLATLARNVGGTAFLSIYQSGTALCLERLHDDRSIEVRWWTVGGNLPLNCGGAPKLLLAYQSEREIAAVLSRPLHALTPKSITDPERLRRRLARIRRQGWEIAIDDVALGLTAIAAPLLDASGRFHGAISISSLTPHIAADNGRQRYLDLVLDAARQLTPSIR